MRFKIKRVSDSIFNPGKPCDRAGFVGPGQRRWKTRLCKVNNELGYFHTWEHYSTVIDASPMIGGHPGGVISYVRGIVEFQDGVRHVTAESIKFCDEINEGLTMMANRYENSPSYKDSVKRSKEPIDEIIDRVLGGENDEST